MATYSLWGWAFFPFLIVTILYFYIVKPNPKQSLIGDAAQSEYFTQSSKMSAMYFLILLIIQVSISWIVVSASGCDIIKNKGQLTLEIFTRTVLPWTCIFGLSILIITLKPNFKAVFSNVYGYFKVNAEANDLINTLLKNQKEINEIKPDANAGTSADDMQNLADAILKICGNKSILINNITPENFVEYMNMLKPLMKPDYSGQINESFFTYKKGGEGTTQTDFFANEDNIFSKIFGLVVTRDKIGEFSWYLYTAFLVISIVTYNIASMPCN